MLTHDYLHTGGRDDQIMNNRQFLKSDKKNRLLECNIFLRVRFSGRMEVIHFR